MMSRSKFKLINHINDIVNIKSCRICYEINSSEINPLITPCKCDGSLKYIHYNCLNKWLLARIHNNKYKCEICNGEYIFLENTLVENIPHSGHIMYILKKPYLFIAILTSVSVIHSMCMYPNLYDVNDILILYQECIYLIYICLFIYKFNVKNVSSYIYEIVKIKNPYILLLAHFFCFYNIYVYNSNILFLLIHLTISEIWNIHCIVLTSINDDILQIN